MSEIKQENLEAEMIDPPESQGGSGAAALSGTEIKPLDPPEGNGSGGGKIAVNNG
jgi:hypothetical protein